MHVKGRNLKENFNAYVRIINNVINMYIKLTCTQKGVVNYTSHVYKYIYADVNIIITYAPYDYMYYYNYVQKK